MATLHAGNIAAKRVASNPLLELLERLGYVARGALYVMMGLLALGVALRIGGGQTTDLTGSLVFMVGNPYGKLVLMAFAIGLAAYSLCGDSSGRSMTPSTVEATPPVTRRDSALSPAQSPTPQS